MLLQTKFLIKVIFLFSLALSDIQNAFAQYGNLIIKGNIKLTKEYDRDVDECFFYYKHILSDENVIIPIRRDSLGNFLVDMQLDTYQQIYFSKVINIDGQTIFNTGMTYFSFFGKPGQIMQLNFIQRPFKLAFFGDFAAENNQYQTYKTAQQNGVKNLYDIQNSKLTSAQVKERALTSFKDQLHFNKQYFKTHPVSSFVQQQAYFNALYQTQSAAIQLNLMSGNKVTEAMVTDFYKSMNDTGHTYKDGPGVYLKNILEPNPSLKNAGALGNSDYKKFISDYFTVSKKNMKFDKVQDVNFKDMAAYLMKKYSDLKQEDKLLLAKFLDNKAIYTDTENTAMISLANLYSNEFLQTRENRAELAKYLAIKDPALRDLGATMSLYKKLDFNQVDYLESSINDYSKGVKNMYLKNQILTAYTDQLDKLHHSKLSPLSVLNSSDSLNGPDLLKKLLEKYKGKVVYLDTWATWCSPCIAGMETSKKLREMLKGKDVVFVYLCLDSPNKTGWKNIIAAKNIEGENYFLDPNQSAVVGKVLNIKSIPHYAMVDKNGNIIEKKAPSPGEPEALKIINDLLGN